MRRLFSFGFFLSTIVFTCGLKCDASPERFTTEGSISIPAFEFIKRITESKEITPEENASRTYALETKAHKPIGDAYVIVTDHTEPQFLIPLQKLANFHKGKIIQIRSFANLCTDSVFRLEIKEKLLEEKPRFVAMAPTIQTYQENVLLAFWQILSELGPEPGLDAFPGIIVAPDSASLSNLIDRSTSYSEVQPKPFIVSQVTDCGDNGHRALQKMRIIRKYFDQEKIATTGLLVRTFAARACRESLPVEKGEYELQQERPGVLISNLGKGVSQDMEDANLVMMFGHGVPGMTCSLDVGAFRAIGMTNKIILSGSCFSAAPLYPDLPSMKVGIDGSAVKQEKERLFQRALRNGALLFYGHMRTNGGFPEMSVIFESLMNGMTAGEAFQRLTNANLALSDLPKDKIMIPPERVSNPQAAQRHNALLYVMIGDPALCPFPNHLH